MIFGMREHFNGYPYRPPMHHAKEEGTDWPLYKRFIWTYLMPHKWSLLICMLLIALNANYVYVVSYMGQLVVDNILVIKQDVPVNESTGGNRVIVPDKDSAGETSRPTMGLGRRISLGLNDSLRPPEAGRKLLMLGFFYVLTQCFFNCLWRLAGRYHISIAQNVMGQMREDMHRKVMELSLSYHQAMNPGRLLARILSDVESAQGEMLALFLSGASCLSMATVGLVIVFVAEWHLGILILTIAPIYALMYKKKRPFIRHYNQEQRHSNACLYGLVTQKIDAVKAIQSYAQEKREILSFRRLASCYFREVMSAHWIAMGLNTKAQLLAHFCNCAIFLYGGYLVLEGQMSLGKMLFIRTAAITLFQPALEMTNLSFVLQRLRIALQRVAGVLDQKLEFVEDPNSTNFPAPIRKGVELQNVEFTYPSSSFAREADEEAVTSPKIPEPVLRNISLTVPAGTWLCIMGASGCGKTTLLHLLARLYEPTKGRILIDGIDLNDINTKSLRHSLGVVPQEAQIFSGTIRDNIAYGNPDATNEQIMKAASAAQMHDFIMDMKVQYETIVAQKGLSLSGGQRQRLSLARALLTDPELLLLDDCTSALDANTERKIQDTLATILVGKTAIMVSQRISMAMRCHKICVLENGTITEYGTHHELLARHGFYAKLYTQQTGQQIP